MTLQGVVADAIRKRLVDCLERDFHWRYALQRETTKFPEKAIQEGEKRWKYLCNPSHQPPQQALCVPSYSVSLKTEQDVTWRLESVPAGSKSILEL